MRSEGNHVGSEVVRPQDDSNRSTTALALALSFGSLPRITSARGAAFLNPSLE